MDTVDILIVGAGPAGMSAAVGTRRFDLKVMVIDDQPEPGGQIWRSVERTVERDKILGPSYVEGRQIAEMFRASGTVYRPRGQLWHLEPGFRAFVSENRRTRVIGARAVILATGAQERPIPFPGWTLPGVLTVGAAQILLKNAGQIPAGPVWIAGSGPLPLLYAVQLLRAGGQIAGYIDTTPTYQLLAALKHLPRAFRGASELLKGLDWIGALRRSKVPMVKAVTQLEALGKERIKAVRYSTIDSAKIQADANTLLVHEGIVPNIHVALAMGCDVTWTSTQDCYTPVLDSWGESSQSNLFIVGDGAGIAGAKAAQLRGELAALRVAAKLGRAREREIAGDANLIRQKLERELAVRPFLDSLFRPRPEIFAPADETIVCRCEEVTAGQIRELATIGCLGPNQVKAAIRVGMGPCQGRQCGYTVTRILSAAQNRPPREVGYFHIRPPLRPVTLGELAHLAQPMPGTCAESDLIATKPTLI